MSEPRRLHPLAALLVGIRIARNFVIPAVLPLTVTTLTQGPGMPWNLLIVVLAGALLIGGSATYGLLAWRRYTYQIADGELRVEQGVINHQRRAIPLQRVQSIDLVQGVLHRLLGVVEVRVETAGGSAAGTPELSLIAVSRADAVLLQQAVAGQRGARQAVATDGPAPEPRLIRQISPGELVLAGMTSGRAGVALAVLASALGLLDTLIPYEALYGWGASLLGAMSLVVVVVALVIAAWLLGLVGTVLAHAGFRLSRSEDTLLIERGLLERRRATIPLARVQAVRIVEGVLRQPFGLAEIRIESAGYGPAAGESTVLFPLVRRSEIAGLLANALPAFTPAPALIALPARSRRRYVTGTLIPVAVLAVLTGGVIYRTTSLFDVAGPVVLLAIASGSVWLGLRRFADAGWAVTDDVLTLRWRRLTRFTAIVQRRSVQSVSVRQSLFQRRADLATFDVRVASGTTGTGFRVAHLDATTANALLAWCGPTPKTGQRPEQPATTMPPAYR